jgi:lipoprotein-anchoring transpeptidase ErfK/SrfK
MAATMVLALENVAVADPLAFVAPSHHQSTIFDRIFRDQGRGPDTTKDTGVPANVAGGHRGQVVSYATGEAPDTVVIDTPNAYLYFIVGGGKQSVTVSVSVAKVSPGLACRSLRAKLSGRIGRRRPKCSRVNPIYPV